MNEAEKIREELKKLGINSRQVSVKHHYSMYDGIIYIKIKDITIKRKIIEEVAKKFESVRYDEHCGEILQGANTFIEISYDYNAFEKYKEEHKINEKAQEIYNMGEKQRDQNHQIIDGDPRFIFNIHENLLLIHENENGRFVWKHWNLNGIYGIAKTLLHYELNHYEPLDEFREWEKQEEEAFQIRMKKQEEERIQWEKEEQERKTARKIAFDAVNANSSIKEVAPEEQTISTYKWARMNKNGTLEEYTEQIAKAEYYTQKAKTTHIWTFNTFAEFDYLRNHLLTDFEQLKGLGGTYSDDPRLDGYADIYKAPRDIIDSIEWINLVISVVYDGVERFVIDPQGYSYARYVGLK